MTKLDPTKIYYVAHPATSCGDYWDNQYSESECFIKMQAIYGESIGMSKREIIDAIEIRLEPIKTIRPLKKIPSMMTDDDDVMDRCFQLLSACHAIVLCGDWKNSKGCLQEKEYAERLGLEVLTFEEVVG